MAQAKVFVIDRYLPSWEDRTIAYMYRTQFDDGSEETYTETLRLPDVVFERPHDPLIDYVLQDIHIVLGISYFKMYCAPAIEMPYALSGKEASFWTTVYTEGLGEFAFRNALSLRGNISFPSHDVVREPVYTQRRNQVLVGIGGGKESAVSIELLKERGYDPYAFIVETHVPQHVAHDMCRVAGLTPLVVRRTLDPKLLEKREGVYRGHVPVSAMYAMIGTLLAVLYDARFVAVGNEASSNFGNVEHDGEVVNHQWSKSSVFEALYREHMHDMCGDSVTYFSLLRPFHELRIAQEFARFPHYFDTFASCNRNFVIDPAGRPHGKWCGMCAKCAFVYTMLAPYIERQRLVGIFGKDMLLDESLHALFYDITGYGTMKPFDCVGTFEEARAAMYAVRDVYADAAIVRDITTRFSDGGALLRHSLQTHPAPLVPPQFVFCGMHSVALLGYGIEGQASERFLRATEPQCTLAVLDESRGDVFVTGACAYDCAVRSPGVPLSSVPVQSTTATNLFLSRVRDTHTVIGVTGSKGKSTTSALIHAMLVAGGVKSYLLGNGGTPMLGTYLDGIEAGATLVLELSSYQLEDVQYAPHIAVVTSLFPDHVPHHGTLTAYYAAKERIVTLQNPGDAFVFDDTSPVLRTWAQRGLGTPHPYAHELPLPFAETRLIGAHNEANMRAAVTVARMCGVSDDAIVQTLRTFEGLPHRLACVGTYKGITFYDDAIATTPEATLAALAALGHVATLFLGGDDRGYDFTALIAALPQYGVRNVVLFPHSGDRIQLDASRYTVLRTSSMHEAVQFAYAHTREGELCLLSCASPSYSLWKNFEEKGNQFIEEVKKM